MSILQNPFVRALREIAYGIHTMHGLMHGAWVSTPPGPPPFVSALTADGSVHGPVGGHEAPVGLSPGH